MARAEVFIKITGAKQLVSTLNSLAPELRKTSEKAVLRAGAKPLVKKSQALAPVRTGSLKKSIGSNVRKNKDGIMTARVGPRAGFKGPSLGMKVHKKGKKAGQAYEAFVRPQNYSHLVEYGTSHSPAKSFIRAATVGASDEVLGAMANGLSSYLDKVARRVRRAAK